MRKLLANIQIPIHALIQGSWKWQYGAYRNANVSLSQVTQIWFHLHLPKFQCNGSAWHRWQNGQNWLPKWLQLRYNNTECYWERCWQSMTYMSHGQARYIYIVDWFIILFWKLVKNLKQHTSPLADSSCFPPLRLCRGYYGTTTIIASPSDLYTHDFSMVLVLMNLGASCVRNLLFPRLIHGEKQVHTVSPRATWNQTSPTPKGVKMTSLEETTVKALVIALCDAITWGGGNWLHPKKSLTCAATASFDTHGFTSWVCFFKHRVSKL